MRILLTNDDGIHSPGLWSVARALKDLGELIVVAPDRDQSGVGPAMTLLHILRAQQVFSPVEGVKAFAVEGTPGDCVILATEHLFNDMPIDLVVSGANLGANLGLDVMTSGTVGGAFHGYFRNIPSIAVSVASLTDVQYEAAATTARALVQAICRDFLPRPLLLNVNLPNVPPDRIEGVQLTRLGPRIYLEGVERGNDGRRTHYLPNVEQIEVGVFPWSGATMAAGPTTGSGTTGPSTLPSPRTPTSGPCATTASPSRRWTWSSSMV